jgi:predicted nucleic-acid-binding Zn-ribbon protein
MRTIDLSGRRFGRLLVQERGENLGKKSAWRCACDCGAETLIRSDHLLRGQCVSCGCHRAEKARVRLTTHGLSKTRPYRIWRDMINRCHYEGYPERHLYGGRGIVVCQRWRESFEAFVADMGLPPAGLSIDRIDTNGNYEPGNCRWATPTEQARNRRPRTRNVESARHALTA